MSPEDLQRAGDKKVPALDDDAMVGYDDADDDEDNEDDEDVEEESQEHIRMEQMPVSDKKEKNKYITYNRMLQ